MRSTITTFLFIFFIAILSTQNHAQMNIMESSIKNKEDIIVLSPHLDDGIWSCGAFMFLAAENNCNVEMITVHAGGPKEKDLPRLQQKEITDKGSPENRIKEDASACRVLGTQPIWWDYPTRLLRKPWLKKRLHVFDTPDGDSILADPQFKSIKNKIKDIIKRHPEALLLCPMGVGNMYDHVELFAACIHAGHELQHLHRMFFYEDSYAILTGPRKEHFILKKYVWAKKSAPERSSFWWRMMGRVMSKSSSKTDIRTCMPTELANANWKHLNIDVSGAFSKKMESLSHYQSQMSQFGGMKRVRKVFKRYHAFWQNTEPYWYIQK